MCDFHALFCSVRFSCSIFVCVWQLTCRRLLKAIGHFCTLVTLTGRKMDKNYSFWENAMKNELKVNGKEGRKFGQYERSWLSYWLKIWLKISLTSYHSCNLSLRERSFFSISRQSSRATLTANSSSNCIFFSKHGFFLEKPKKNSSWSEHILSYSMFTLLE